MRKKESPEVLKLKKQLGSRIRKLRDDRELTQSELAGKMGLETSYLGLIETGKIFPRATNFIKIAAALGVPFFQLFMFEGDIPLKERTLSELIDLLKSGDDQETKFLLSVARERRKSYG